jgi:alcohol dehydrogenase class IV
MFNRQVFQFPIIYTFERPKVAIGWGVHETVADECKAANIKKALIVTTGLKGTGIVEQVNSILNGNGISTAIFDKVTSNPKDHEVMEGYKVYKEAECDGVISVGGGSSHDCSKAIRAVATYDGMYVWDIVKPPTEGWMKAMEKYKRVTIPQISINTTAGTASEAFIGASIHSSITGDKGSVDVKGGTPTVALIDPLFVRMMPATYAAWTGWDAFTHAYESFLNRIQVPGTHAMQLGTMKLIAENIREFATNRMNHVACERMCHAESMAGVGLILGGSVGIVHGLANAIGGVTDGHHGFINAILTSAAVRYNAPACPDLFAEMAGALGIDTRSMTRMQAVDRCLDEIDRMLSDLKIQSGHLKEQLGMKPEDIKFVVDQYSKGFLKETNPAEFNYDEVTKFLEDLM